MKYIWDSNQGKHGKWIPADEYNRSRPKRTLYYSVFKSGFNHGLGQYVGSSGDVRGACNRIESETGSRPVEMGTSNVQLPAKRKGYEMPRGALEAIKNGK